MPVSDERLIRDALAGRHDAYAELLRRHERPVFSVISRLVGDPGVTEELAQETFLKAFRRLDTFDQHRSFSAWVLRIAHNTTVDALRRRGPDTVFFSADAADARVAVSGHPGPDRETEHRLRLRDLSEAMARLRPEHRVALVLRYQEGQTYEQIAYVMGVAEGTAKSHVHRARRQLAAELRRAGWGAATTASVSRSTE